MLRRMQWPWVQAEAPANVEERDEPPPAVEHPLDQRARFRQRADGNGLGDFAYLVGGQSVKLPLHAEDNVLPRAGSTSHGFPEPATHDHTVSSDSVDNLDRSEEHTYELPSTTRISYTIYCFN